MPKFSIIIPVYNVAHPAIARSATRRFGSGDTYLHECLDSVLAQTFTDWEAICVDDGSTDGSGAILDEYAARDSRFRVIHQQNAGVSEARQRGLENVCGKYFGFVDPDDWIEPTMYETLVMAAEGNGADYLWENFCQDSAHGAGAGSQRCDGDNREQINALLSGRVLASLCSRLFRTEFVKKNGIRFLRGRITACEDLCFICEVLASGAKTKFVEAAHYHYRDVGGSLTHRSNMKMIQSFQMVGDRLMEKLGDTPSRAAVLEFRRNRRADIFLCQYVDNQTFASFFPEAKTIGAARGKIRGGLFWLSTHGFRGWVMALAGLVRRLKGVNMTSEVFHE